jgi:hypothetical protein
MSIRDQEQSENNANSGVGDFNPSRELALLAHKAAIREIGEIQQRMALRKAVVAEFGPLALPVREFFRDTIPSRQQTMTEAQSYVAMEEKAELLRLGRLYAVVNLLEPIFAEMHKAGARAFADAMAEHLRRGGFGA